MLFISKQSFKELSEWARSASDGVLGQGGSGSTLPALRSLLILFSAEYSCQPRAKHWATCYRGECEGGGKGEREENTKDQSVYPCDDNEGHGGIERR